jgi:hypothetical protein
MFIGIANNDLYTLPHYENYPVWIDYISSILINKLEKQIGIEACFIYGSSQFKRISDCNDIDIFLISKSHLGLFWISIESPYNPKLSVTITDLPTLKNDLKYAKKAGFILNKFINPITPLINASLILFYKSLILSTLSKTLCINNYFDILLWKDHQFPNWRKYHSLIIRNCKIIPSNNYQNAFLEFPNDRGHWDVYRSLKTDWGKQL